MTEQTTMTHALVILCMGEELGFDADAGHQQVLLFSSESAAQKWAVDRIVEFDLDWKRSGEFVVSKDRKSVV
jgi:hypothetical protein